MADAFGRTHISAASDFQAIRCPDPPTRDRKRLTRGVALLPEGTKQLARIWLSSIEYCLPFGCRQDDVTAVDSVRGRNRAIARLASAKATKIPVSISESVHVRACVLRSCATLEVSVAIV